VWPARAIHRLKEIDGRKRVAHVSGFSQNIEVGFVGSGDRTEIEALEALPIDSLWTGGHIASRNPSSDAMIGLARLAAHTERVRIGTSVLLLPLYPPAVIARQVADLDRMTSGRVILGVGVGGEYPQEFLACQVPLRERGARVNEAIPLIRELWKAQPVTATGAFYPMEDVRMHPGPVQEGGVPIVVAGRQEAAMRRAARLGDGWLPYLYSPKRYAASVRTIRAVAGESGRGLDDFGWFVWLFTNVQADGQAAREECAAFMGGNYRQDFGEMVDNVAAAGTPEEVTEKLKAFFDAGARHFVFMTATRQNNAQTIRRHLLEECVPGLREHAGSSQSPNAAGGPPPTSR
jgi:probable F420-dependent oxidoreductase